MEPSYWFRFDVQGLMERALEEGVPLSSVDWKSAEVDECWHQLQHCQDRRPWQCEGPSLYMEGQEEDAESVWLSYEEESFGSQDYLAMARVYADDEEAYAYLVGEEGNIIETLREDERLAA